MLSRPEIEAIGFAEVGDDVRISEFARFHGAHRIRLGNHVRIDDFCVLSAGAGGIRVGSYVHIAVYSALIGQGAIALADFCNLSSRVAVYSSSDDFSGETLTNPTIPDAFKNVTHLPVTLGKHVIVGCGAVILPGVTLEEGVAIGALSLVKEDCRAYGIYAGNPARRIKERSRALQELEARLLCGNPSPNP